MIRDGASIIGINKTLNLSFKRLWDIYFDCETILKYYDRMSIVATERNPYVTNTNFIKHMVEEMNYLLDSTYPNNVMMLDISVVDLTDDDINQLILLEIPSRLILNFV